MPAIGIGLGWLAYSLGLWGWCLLKDYDVTLGELMSPLHPYGSGKGQPWPPKRLADTKTFPGAGIRGATGPPQTTAAPAPGGAAPAPGTLV